MIGGRIYPIRTDFRAGIQFETAATAGTLTAEDFYRLWFPAERPEDLEAAIAAVGRFYNLGEEGDGSGGAVPYRFDRDMDVIYGDFLRVYGLDLARAELHWWQFRTLLEGLITHSFRERVGYRTADLRGLDAAQRAEILKYRARYRIEGPEDDLESHLRRLQALAGRQSANTG